MLLSDCKAEIDAGKTAKHLRWRSILHYLVRKQGNYYARHAEGYTNPSGLVIIKQETTFYQSWEELLYSLDLYAESAGWLLTNEKFADYLPPERKTAP